VTKRLISENSAKPVTVGEVMTPGPVTCAPDAPLADAVHVMWIRDCGFVPVTESPGGRLCGVVTDRDACMAAYTQGRSLAEIPVRSAMATDVVTVGEDDLLSAAHERMRDRQVRRLPVVDRGGRVVGVISLNDVAIHARGREEERRAVSSTLAEVCRHRDLVTA
jgi:CBS domain-containing protein